MNVASTQSSTVQEPGEAAASIGEGLPGLAEAPNPPGLGRVRRVLITHGWCRTAYTVASCLARAGFHVSACGSSSLSMTRVSRYVRGFDRTPDFYQDPAGYVASLAEIVARRRIDLLLPVHEDGLAIQAHRDRLPPTLIVASPPLGDLVRATDKWEILRVAEAAGVDIPRTHAPTSIAEAIEIAGGVDYPILIKTRRGNSGKGVFGLDDPRDVARVFPDVVGRFGLDDERPPSCKSGSTAASTGAASSQSMERCWPASRSITSVAEGEGWARASSASRATGHCSSSTPAGWPGP